MQVCIKVQFSSNITNHQQAPNHKLHSMEEAHAGNHVFFSQYIKGLNAPCSRKLGLEMVDPCRLEIKLNAQVYASTVLFHLGLLLYFSRNHPFNGTIQLVLLSGNLSCLPRNSQLY
jgi:hypothetical protein